MKTWIIPTLPSSIQKRTLNYRLSFNLRCEENIRSVTMEKYDIVTSIGKGSSGAVFLAKKLQTKKLVAIKRIEIDENRKSRCKKSVVREASILRRFSHPYIVQCEEWFLDSKEEMINIVLEYCDGGTMQDLVRQARFKKSFFPEQKVLKWMAEIVSAVAYMHSKKILHRDLKTENVFIVKPGTAKLGDFGISKEIDHTLDMAQTCVGTPCYLSPELCQDIPYSSKSDVWALGCLLFEMAALKPAFDAANLVSLFYKIVKGDFAALPEHCSTNMRDLIGGILRKDPSERPTAHKLLEHDTLKKFVTQLDGEALPRKVSARIHFAEKKRPPKLAELRDKSGNVEEISSFENSDTITGDNQRTLSPGLEYASNMLISGIAHSNVSGREVNTEGNNRCASVLAITNAERGNQVPRIFAYQAEPYVAVDSPPPQEVETARPQTCPNSASRDRTDCADDEGIADTVLTWSGYSQHDSGNKRGGRSFSSDSDSSSDEYSTRQRVNSKVVRRKKRGRGKSREYSSDSSSDNDPRDEQDDDIPEVIETQCDDCSGDSTNTDEHKGAENGRVLPGSAWLKAKRTQYLKQKENNPNTGNPSNSQNISTRKTPFPGTSWILKDRRSPQDPVTRDRSGDRDLVLGESNHFQNHSPRGEGDIRNLPGSAWLKSSRSSTEIHMKSSPRGNTRPAPKHQSSMVLESYSSGSANEHSVNRRSSNESDTDAEYDSEASYPDDFEDYEDDFELSDDETGSVYDRATQNKSTLDAVRQGCIDLLGKQTFEDLASYVSQGLSLSHAERKFTAKHVNTEALEACYLLLQKQRDANCV